MEFGQLFGVHVVIRVISTGQMGHDQFGVQGQGQFAHRMPFNRFHAQTVHTGVQLNAKRMIGQGFHMPY